MKIAQKSKFLITKPTTMKKEEFVSHLKNIQKIKEISWLITNSRSFEWAEINRHKQEFIKELKITSFNSACVGVFDPKSKDTKYSSFKVTH